MRIHFIGIGGIGVSALARYSLAQGHEVSGSDLAESEITQALEKLGAKVFIGQHKSTNLPQEPTLTATGSGLKVVYSPAITPDNPELKKAYKIQATGYKILIQSYPQALGELTKKYWTIAVGGTHGKGTTTAMISLILIKAGFDPTVIIGTKLREFGDSNFRLGRSKYLVIEADEYAGSFLNYWPKAVVLTTIDKDHLDYFKSLDNIKKAFVKFIKHLPAGGILVINPKFQIPISKQIQNPKFQIRNYSPEQPEAKKLRRILKVPGEHIVEDALAALTLARALKIPDQISFAALASYRGAWRRFEESELKIGNCKLKIINDYAHHPTEIAVTLKAVRQKYPKKKIWCVFQPHQYQRTYYLFKEFVRALTEAPIDKLILTEIYSVAGRESQAIKKKVNSRRLAEAVRKILDTRYKIQDTKIIYISTLSKTAEYLKKNLRGGEVLVVMGAGDIYKLPDLLENRKRR